MNAEKQADTADQIVYAALFLDAPKMQPGRAYEKIANRKGTEFREKVKQLHSNAFNNSILARNYKPEPSAIQKALRDRKKA